MQSNDLLKSQLKLPELSDSQYASYSFCFQSDWQLIMHHSHSFVLSVLNASASEFQKLKLLCCYAEQDKQDSEAAPLPGSSLSQITT